MAPVRSSTTTNSQNARRFSCPGRIDIVHVDLPAAESSQGKTVRFDTVQVNEHEYILGCNACTYADVPLTISWKARKSTVMPVEQFEATRDTRGHSKTYVAMQSKAQVERWNLLEYMGFDPNEVREAKARCEKIRRQQFILKQNQEREQFELEMNNKSLLRSNGKIRKQNDATHKAPMRQGLFNRVFRRVGVEKGKRAPIFADDGF